jgi:hypothetical protein
MSQTSYSTNRADAVAGMVSEDAGCHIDSYPAAEAIPPGRLVVLNSSGLLELPQDTELAKPVGVSVFSPMNQQGAIPAAGFEYAAGDMVPVLQRGRCYADLSGGSPAALVAANVNHSSTVATHRGKFSASAPAGTAGSEISPAGPAMFLRVGPTNVWLVEVNYSGVGLMDAPVAPQPLSLPAFDAGDSAPASIVHGAVYDVPATAANSTISLPAAAPDGTVAHFHADGTKNGHTLTFRDVATAISAATTASKRVAATAMKADGKWCVTLTVGP